MRIWLNAARPRTLPAAVAPVFVGTAAAVYAVDDLPRLMRCTRRQARILENADRRSSAAASDT